MADFNNAITITLKNEGGYANNPNDHGGETFAGIARQFNPGWGGWKRVDAVKNQVPRAKLDSTLFADESLQNSVRQFYQQNYWNVNKLDEVNNQAIANTLFDIGVNMGVDIAAQFLQQALNLTNPNQQLFADLVVDRQIGVSTINALNSHPRPNDVYKWINILRGARYVSLLENNPSQRIFGRSWLSRVDLSKS